jgi:REP element-mobilizing transposase RayT
VAWGADALDGRGVAIALDRRLTRRQSAHARTAGEPNRLSTNVHRLLFASAFSIATSKTTSYKYPAPMKPARQLALPLASTAPRRSRTAHAGRAHRARSRHCHRHPVHVTLRRTRCLPSLRTPIVFAALQRGFTAASRRWFRVVHFGVQDDHLHLLVEADDNLSLSRGMIGLTVRLARAYNRALARRGSVWSERFHARALRTPREVRLVSSMF